MGKLNKLTYKPDPHSTEEYIMFVNVDEVCVSSIQWHCAQLSSVPTVERRRYVTLFHIFETC